MERSGSGIYKLTNTGIFRELSKEERGEYGRFAHGVYKINDYSYKETYYTLWKNDCIEGIDVKINEK